jgi:putative protein-disulfide isomerase
MKLPHISINFTATLRKAVIILFILFSSYMTQAKDSIIYVFDPMCGWCYGFSDIIKNASVKYANDFHFTILSGGMVVGEREGPIGDFADYILGAYPRVEEYSGVKFGEPYLAKLRDKSLYSSSVIPSIAIEVFKSYHPMQAISFASEVQKAYFFKGEDLRSDAVYEALAIKFGINPQEFLLKLHSEEFKKKAFDGYAESHQFGVQGYPAVLAIKNGKYYALTRGFTDEKSLTEMLEKLKSM